MNICLFKDWLEKSFSGHLWIKGWDLGFSCLWFFFLRALLFHCCRLILLSVASPLLLHHTSWVPPNICSTLWKKGLQWEPGSNFVGWWPVYSCRSPWCLYKCFTFFPRTQWTPWTIFFTILDGILTLFFKCFLAWLLEAERVNKNTWAKKKKKEKKLTINQLGLFIELWVSGK